MNVRDLACGPGFTACELAKFIEKGNVTGVDIDEEMLRTAQQARASENVDNVSFHHGNLYDLDLPEAAFDFVYARFVFQHLEKPDLALSNVWNVLKPGGVLCIMDIDDNWISFSPQSAAFSTVTRRLRAGQRRAGGNRTIGSQLYRLLTAAGFQEVGTTVYPVTTRDLGVRLFLGLTLASPLERTGKLQKLLMLPWLKRIKKAAQAPDAWGAAGIFVSTGARG
jgi:ubiquinone/menaquinone biosynthesis C-methylase UbiE